MADTARAPEFILTAWIEANIGPVASIERQGRWRPAWLVDAVKDGENLPLYVRGARVDEIVQPQPLFYEARVFQILAAGGVRVPHVFGYIDEIPAIVMERRPGAPDVNRLESQAERDAVLSQLVDQMALIHQVDPALFEHAGAPRPPGAQGLALAYLRRIEPHYEAQKARPEPVIEFLRGWIPRNVPPAADIAYPIAVDAGQFICEGDRLTAMLDFELSTLGDYHTDLAALRLRDRMEPIGDLEAFYDLYAERSGRVVDRGRIRFHTVIKGLMPALHMAGILGAPTGAADFVQYMSWNAAWLRVALEAIFEIRGWPLEVFVPPATHSPGRYDVVLSLLEADIRAGQSRDEMAQYERRRRLRLAKFTAKAQAYQTALEARHLDGVAGLIGHRPADWSQAEAELEALILRADASQDEAVARLLLRQVLGQCFLLADPEEPGDFAPLTTPLRRLRD